MVSPLDVGDDIAVGSCVRTVVAEHGRIDAIVHCAGVVAFGRTEDIPVEVFDRVLVTNVIGSVNVARHAVPRFREQGHGALVLMGSVVGHSAAPRMTPYVVSKWSVRALARQLQIENRDMPDVSISYVAPGMVDTPIWNQGANYTGFAANPPPPVASPEHVARVVWRRIERPRARTQTGLANHAIRLGFSAVPKIFDRLAGPLFRRAVLDRRHPTAAGPGNALNSVEAKNRVRGQHGSVLLRLRRRRASRAAPTVRPKT